MSGEFLKMFSIKKKKKCSALLPHDRPVIIFQDVYSREIENVGLHKTLYMNLHGSIIHNIQKVEILQMPIN